VKVSVITPSYNQLPYLKLCIASVADQTGVEAEHIIQDAGSDGNVRALIGSNPNIKLFVESDSGMYDAINRGLHRATGEICAYLNCDEQYLPGALIKVSNFFAQNSNVDVLFADIILIGPDGSPLSYRRTILPTASHIRVSHLNTPTCATFFRRELLDKGFYFDTRWKTIGDALWVEKLLRSNIRMAAIREPLAVFALTGKNLGETALSRSEAIDWKRSKENRLISAGAILLHRLRKAFAGAYRPRTVDIEIFTTESPGKRQKFTAKGVGFRWPTWEQKICKIKPGDLC
jgi:glycosyltransferase involved in cell wall biosynthesis